MKQIGKNIKNNGLLNIVNVFTIFPNGNVRIYFCVNCFHYEDNKQDSGILVRLMHISFPNLIGISLRSNNLATIESLNRIYLPVLEGIDLT